MNVEIEMEDWGGGYAQIDGLKVGGIKMWGHFSDAISHCPCLNQ